MAWLDDWMRDNKDESTKWPQQLFLTGDQIYADDVAVALLPMLIDIGTDLLGVPERFPIDETTEVDVNGVASVGFGNCRGLVRPAAS